MGSAKDIILRPISSADASALVKRVHYSGKVVQNSQFHIGVFYQGKLEGAMQFGPSLDKRRVQGLVTGTQWHEFIELNRMAFSDALPRNSESRALGIAMRILKQHAPQLKWVISFADGAQCGDGTIYRASGFLLTSIKKNTAIWRSPTGEVVCGVSITANKATTQNGAASMKAYAKAGWRLIPGFQLRYIYFLDPTYRERLTVPILPFSEIARMGASMYRGQKSSAGSVDSDTVGSQPAEGSANLTPALHNSPGGS